MTRYYSAGGTRVALRNSNGSGTDGLVYLLGDHLGSTSLTADPLDGDKLSELRYKAWGETRHSLTNAPTDRRFTGQTEEMGLGLYYYGARFYDPLLSRWAQPDSIIPQNQGTQAWDRYAYVNNSPLKYTDPTGHMAANEGEGGGGRNAQDDTSSNCIPGLSCPIPTPTSTSIAIPHPSPIPSSTPTLFPTPTTSTTPTPSSTPTLNDLSRIPTNTPGINVGKEASQAGDWFIDNFDMLEPNALQPSGYDLLSPLEYTLAPIPQASWIAPLVRVALQTYATVRHLIEFLPLPPNPISPLGDIPVPELPLK